MAVLKEILSEEAVSEIVGDLARRVSCDFAGKELTVMGILDGAFVFTADLIRKLNVNVTLDFVQISTYGASAISSGKITFLKKPAHDFKGKNVLIVEDIIDTGLTLQFLARYLKENGASLVKTCVFADKRCCRKVPFEADYVGYVAEDRFLVGYGLDYSGQYRQLPGLYELFLDKE